MQVSGQRIVVLGTGGTIAGRATSPADAVGYRAAELGIAELLQGVGAAEGLQLVAEQVAQIDSKDMDFAVWRDLAARCAHWLAQADVAGIVVTHGTDTMEETAFFLQSVLAPAKPVVLTGAMRPATAAAPDGPGNLADAVLVASTRGAQGVSVVFAGAVHGPVDVRKEHGTRLDAFSSGDAGVLAYVEAGRLRQLRAWLQGAPARAVATLPEPARWPRVEIVTSHAGAGGAIVRALVADGVQGLVVAATGNGTLHHALEEALLQAQDRGVAVRRSSRCAQGRVLAHAADRLPAAGGLSPLQARIALMLELMA
ncbi:asparaginase [Ramlibacter pallidus]|uniref:Asparaginase n=1 Tax=Ramlibacter pallidus TaxID=2780087 RepID=A0ABR9S3M8_9BURK|nr:asparaginase [Ramlibacter pallidus]MBE7368124.1 asparaginase [Ramlibacter pallidus]